MSDASTAPTGGTQPSATPATMSGGSSPLQTQQGSTTIADSVVSKIAALAAREVDGVTDLGGSASGAISGMVGRITGGDSPKTAGVGVEVGQTQAAVDLTLKVRYPASIHEVADSVRQSVTDRIESMTGLEVTEVNIAVVDLVFPGSDQQDDGEDGTPSRVE